MIGSENPFRFLEKLINQMLLENIKIDKNLSFLDLF
jgi:hypothetical protein